MAYQRFGEDSDLYIWMSVDALNVWISGDPKTKTVSRDGTQIKFTEENVKEAETLFLALHDHLSSCGRKINFNKKTGEVSVQKVKK